MQSAKDLSSHLARKYRKTALHLIAQHRRTIDDPARIFNANTSLMPVLGPCGCCENGPQRKQWASGGQRNALLVIH